MIVVEVVFFEAHVGRPLFKDIYDMLYGMDFELAGTYGFAYSKTGLPLQCDATFITKLQFV